MEDLVEDLEDWEEEVEVRCRRYSRERGRIPAVAHKDDVKEECESVDENENEDANDDDNENEKNKEDEEEDKLTGHLL